MCAGCRGFGIHGGGYGGGYRADGQCGNQVFPGGYGYADHADEPYRGSDICRGCLWGADGADGQCGREYEKPGGYPGRLPGGVFADVGGGEGGQCGGSGGEECHERVPGGDERGSWGY